MTLVIFSSRQHMLSIYSLTEISLRATDMNY